jgi:diguanylate cyclase (GGDEF)-like protein/PAS domain S-box-containing protein
LVVEFDRRRDTGTLSVAEAAALAGVRPQTVRAWCASGRLAFRPGQRHEHRIDPAVLDEFLSTRATRRTRRPEIVREQVTRASALRHIATELSGTLDLPSLFGQVMDYAGTLFGIDACGLWLYEQGDHPLRLVAHRGLGSALLAAVERVPANNRAAGMSALRRRAIKVITPRGAATPELRRAYAEHGIQTICFVPVVFHDEPQGLLVLYHTSRHAWPAEELELAGAFGAQMAAAIANARLHEGVQNLAARLRAISDLAVSLNRINDVAGIGTSIVTEAHSLIDHDTIRVYQVDEAAATCEPIAFQGRFLGSDDPSPEMLRVRMGQGITGWVAANGKAVRTGDAANDQRGLVVGSSESGPESMLVVPMNHDGRVRGVIVLSKAGRDRFSQNDETTLSIFANYAAQAMANAENSEQVRRQQAELEHQLASQRRLLEVNERLLSTLDPHGVLEMIADSLRSVVAYDTLGLYVADWEAGVRRAVVARDRFADVILAHASAIHAGITGWVIEHGEGLLANDVHLDPRSTQIPGTPFEPESMLIVPLVVDGRVEGTLNVGRIGDGAVAYFTTNEFELTKLFAAQASIALQNARAHTAIAVRADLDALTGLRNHGSFQRELSLAVDSFSGSPFALLLMDLDDFKAFNDSRGHPAGDRLLQSIGAAIEGTVRDGDRVYRYGGDEFAVVLANADRRRALEIADRIRHSIDALIAETDGPRVGISIGVACFPADGRTKDDLVVLADRALYLVKPSRRGEDPAIDQARDAYLSALNETALALMDRLDPTELLQTIVHRAAGLMGTPHGFLYVVEPDESALVVRVGTGLFGDFVGYRAERGTGVSGRVWATGQPMTVDDYDAYTGRLTDMPKETFGAIIALPLETEGRIVGVIGLASGTTTRTFGDREIAVLGRFAQLASIAMTNARLFEATQREVTERARAEEALRVSEERFRRLSDATTEALLITRNGVILEVNQAMCRLFAYTPEELVGRSVLDLVAPESLAFIKSLMATGSDAPFEALGLTKTGETFPLEVVARTIPYADGQEANVSSVHDLRERRQMEERLARQTLYDTLTGLPNRVLLMDRLRHALTWARPGDSAPLALVLLDLDRFKVVNDSLGHRVGDELLVAVAQRLQRCLRPGDTVARFGGDEFGILLDSIGSPADAEAVAVRIEAELAAPFELSGRDVYASASLGIAVGDPGSDEPEDLLRQAEIALYRAKGDSAVRHALFEPSMSAATIERLDLENDLRGVIERNELRVFYQPLIDLATDRIAGLEALVRWQHPTRGLVPPLSFIPLAEETGLILPIGRWVLETACRQAREWQLAFPSDEPLTISVNLSARQFAQPDLVDQVRSILVETGLPAETLELEITESVVMDQSEVGIAALRALRDLGCRLALDDFGTGYSSLSYLKTLPLDTIKIDRSFVAGLSGDDANLPIVQAVIALAHGLGIDVTAEGIETAEQLGWLRELVCDRGQGFYYAKPAPANELESLLRPDRPRPSRDGATRVAIRSRGARAEKPAPAENRARA